MRSRARKERQARILAGLRNLTAGRAQLDHEMERASRGNEVHQPGDSTTMQARLRNEASGQAEAELRRDLKRQKEHILSMAEAEADNTHQKPRETEAARKARLARNADRRKKVIEDSQRSEPSGPPQKPAKRTERTKAKPAARKSKPREYRPFRNPSPEEFFDQRDKVLRPGASVGGKKPRVNKDEQSSKPEFQTEGLSRQESDDLNSEKREPDMENSLEVPLTEFMPQGNRSPGVEPSTKGKERLTNEDGKSSQAKNYQSKPLREFDSKDQGGKDTGMKEAKRGRPPRPDQDVDPPEPREAKATKPTEGPQENHEGRTSSTGVLSKGQRRPTEEDEEPLKSKRLKTGEPTEGTDSNEDCASNVEIFNRGKKRAASESEALPEAKKLRMVQPLRRRHSSSAIYSSGGRGSQNTGQTAKNVDEGKKHLVGKSGQPTTAKKRGIARPIKRPRKPVYDDGTESSRSTYGVGKANLSENTLKDPKNSSRKASEDKQESSKLLLPEVKERNRLQQKHTTEKDKVVGEGSEIHRPQLVYSDNYTSPEEKIALLPQYYFFKSRAAKSSTNGQKREREEENPEKAHKKQRTTKDAKESEKPATEASPLGPNVPRKKISLSTYIAKKKQGEARGEES